METNVHSWHYRYHLTSVVWKRKTCAINGNNIDSRMSLLIFLSRFQIENYVMTAFSIQPIKTILFHLRVAVAKFQYPCVNGLMLFYRLNSIRGLFILSISLTRLPCRIKCFLEFSLILEHGETAINGIFLCLTSKITHNKHFASFQPQVLLLLLKEVAKTFIFTQKWLDRLLLMTSYFVTIVTDRY